MIRAVIIDDESNQRENVRLILENHCDDVEVVAEGESAMEGMNIIKKHNPDVVFLDIQMPGGTGLDLLQTFEQLESKVVLVTAYANHMKDAFKVNVFDYLVKPIDIDEMIDTVDRIRNTIPKKTSSSSKVGLPSTTGFIYVEKKDIEYVGANGSYTEVYRCDEEKLLISKNLKYFENILDENQFMRIHRSSIVNIAHIKEFSRSQGGLVKLTSGHEIQVSSDKKNELLKRLEEL